MWGWLSHQTKKTVFTLYQLQQENVAKIVIHITSVVFPPVDFELNKILTQPMN